MTDDGLGVGTRFIASELKKTGNRKQKNIEQYRDKQCTTRW